MTAIVETVETIPFDIADHLGDAEAITILLAEALETGDAGYIAHALGQVARARGMAGLAAETGLARESLYRSLSRDGNPRLATLLDVLKALDLRLAVVSAGA